MRDRSDDLSHHEQMLHLAPSLSHNHVADIIVHKNVSSVQLKKQTKNMKRISTFHK